VSENNFIDYYELMQISPNAEPATIVRVFRMLAARYHPDNRETGQLAVFHRLMEGYKVLSDPVQRAEYDRRWQEHCTRPIALFTQSEFQAGLDGEANRRLGILTLLYSRRRSNPENPGMSVLDLERAMTTPREHLIFTLWYLKEKDLIAQVEASDYVVTHLGVDHVESNLIEPNPLLKLLKSGENGTVSRGHEPTDQFEL
jgi:curved DNA-binding protein CbpA